jgi:hypothetical protein
MPGAAPVNVGLAQHWSEERAKIVAEAEELRTIAGELADQAHGMARRLEALEDRLRLLCRRL